MTEASETIGRGLNPDVTHTRQSTLIEPPGARTFDLFRSEDFVVRAVTGFDPTVCVVTFDSYSDRRTLDRPGFGEAFFRERRIDAIHVIARANDWYQHEEILKICETIAAATATYARVYAYGSSMGGYAAIRFGGFAGAESAIALSPQFSIDKKSAAFEHRWETDGRRIDFSIERKQLIPFVKRAFVAYDPNDLDSRHVELFRRKTSLIEAPIPGAGHPVTGFLAEAGLLGEFVLGIVRETLDVTSLLARANAMRERTPQYWGVLAERSDDPVARVKHASRALALAPSDMGYKVRYARALARNEEFDAAEPLFLEILRDHPDNPVLLSNLSEMYEWRGDLKAALDVARRLAQAHADAGVYEQRVAYLTTRYRIATVVSSVADVARKGVGGPLNALIRRVREGARAIDPRGATPVDVLTTTTPSPPPFVHSWLRHVDLTRDAPNSPVDLLLVGDSHVQYWPEALWEGRTLYNFGVAADKTQHVLWRLMALQDGSVRAREAVLMVGVNNLGADDTPAGIAAGVVEILSEIARVAPDAALHVVAVPPCGEALEFRDRERRRANALIRDRRPLEFVEVDGRLRIKQEGVFACYQDDAIHLSPHGYKVLTDALTVRFKR